MPERSFSTQAYRYGFNGKEFDSEWKGEGNSYDYGFRVHDARLGRFLSVDPLVLRYPMLTPFQFAGNSPIRFVDVDGLEPGDPQNFRYNVMLLTPLSPTGPLQGLGNPVMYFADGYWILQFEHRSNAGHHEYYYSTDGDNMVKFWDSYEIEIKRREVWLKSVDIMAKIFVFEMEIALMGPEMIAEGILEKGAELVIKKVAKKYAPKASKWMLRKADELYARVAQRLRKYKPCGCFTEGTLVLTANGLVPIENIVVGDSVWARNDSTGKITIKTVLSTFEREFGEVYRLYFGGTYVEATYEHPFFVNGGWVTAENVRVGDTLFSSSGTGLILDSVSIRVGTVTVRNLEVKDDHTYFVSERGILVHNGNPCFQWVTKGLDDIKRFVSTESSAQGMTAIEDIKKKIRAGDYSVWAEPIETVNYNGKTYIIDGHNRLEAIKEMGYQGKVSIKEFSVEGAMKNRKSKMEEIMRGDHD